MALSNENNPHLLAIPLGSAAVDLRQLVGPSVKRIKVLSAHLLNGAAIAASDTDYIQVSLEKGPVAGTTVVAELDSRAAHENGIAANIPEPLNLVDAETLIDEDTLISVNHNETDAGTNVALTNAMLLVNYQVA